MDKQFRMFTVGRIFTVERAKGIPAKKDLTEGNIPYVTRATTNNGHMGTCGNIDKINPGNCITIGGETAIAFYQPVDFVAGNNMCRLSIEGLSENHYLYLAGVLNKLAKNYSYSNARTLERIKKEQIPLPVTTVTVPDWPMLESLLEANGGGEAADMSKIDTSSWKQFKVSDLFGKAKLGKYHNPETLAADSKGYEYICASNLNNGVNKDLPRVTGANLQLTAPNIIAWGKQCPMFTYHKDPCVTSQGMYYIELDKLSEACALFIITLLEHACKGQYGYNNCLIGSKFDELEISLPVTSVEQPDWDYMQERIAELEQERIAELEQYLIAAGLNDYTLTDEDLEVLRLFRGEAA